MAGSFQTRITVKATSPNPDAPLPDNLSYNYQFKLKPGLYQVRVAVRDEKTGHTGSARQWIEIPDLTSGKLMLGSLILGEKTAAAIQLVNQSNPLGYANLSIDHRFARTSHLRFLAFVYNATRRANIHTTVAADASEDSRSIPTAAPDVAIQVQVLRDDQPVLTTTLRSIEIYPETDVARLPYAAELPLSDMQPGRYMLQVTVIDRIARTSATQQAGFIID